MTGSLEALAHRFVDAPDDAVARQQLLRALERNPAVPRGGAVEQAIATLAGADDVNHQRLVPLALRRFLSIPGVTSEVRSLDAEGSASSETVETALADPLSRRLLCDHLYGSQEIELVLTALRRRWLKAAIEGSDDLPGGDLLGAVALQLLNTEWVYDETAEETQRVDLLADRLASDEVSLPHILVHAMYRPLSALDSAAAIEAQLMAAGGLAQEVGFRHLSEPAEERRLAASIPRVTGIVDPVSQAVRAQYEERPYPRWRRVAPTSQRRLGASVAAAVADPSLAERFDREEPHILIAGCGTGRHAVLTAQRYPGARVVAVDLSLTSLAYGVRQARHLGVDNVEFAQADLLALGSWQGRFDVVEAVGVLHHLEDPERGWRVLRDSLRPGGAMKLGLYSTRGRAFLDPVLDQIAVDKLEPSADGIRVVRRMVQGSPDRALQRLLAAPDFYSRSGCRDLFFHAHETRFDLVTVSAILERLGLEFLGFELPEARIRSLYLDRFPDDSTLRSLRNWDRLEAEFPHMFSAMYRFWVAPA